MDNQIHNWIYNLYQENNMDELRESLVMAMEIENIRVKAQEEFAARNLEIAQLKALLVSAIKERDEAQDDWLKACFQKASLRRQKRLESSTYSGISSVDEEEDRRRRVIEQHSNGSSSCDESMSSYQPMRPAEAEENDDTLVPDKPLPENGKLLEAVVKAGPILQTLLLGGGPLPKWNNPPPPLDTCQIPPPPPMVCRSLLCRHCPSVKK